jgi:hypothetical protein
VITIATTSEAHATCIRRTLDAFGSAVEQTEHGWTVSLPGDQEIAPVLNALDQCLGDNGIPSVTVTYRGRSYVMEGTAS